MKDVTVAIGEQAHFQTTVEAGWPVPEVKWFLNRKDATDGQQGSRCKVERTQNKCELTISNCHKNDSGSVSVEAANAVGEDKKTVTLFVEGA